MKRFFVYIGLGLFLVGCSGNGLEPTVDFKEDEVLLEKIRNKYADSPEATNETNSLYHNDGVDLLSDFKVNLKVGDVIFITVNENISRNSVGRKQNITNSSMAVSPMNVTTPEKEHKITSQVIGKLQPLFNLGVESDKSSSFQGNTNAINEESFETSINAIITRKVTADLFYIEATKTIMLNAEKQTVKLTGYVHKNDVDNAYTVDSSKVVDLKVLYDGEGSASDAQNSSLINRVFDKIFF